MRAVNVSHKETYEPVCFPNSRLSDIERGPHDGDTWPRQPAKPVSVASLSSSLFHIGKLKMKPSSSDIRYAMPSLQLQLKANFPAPLKRPLAVVHGQLSGSSDASLSSRNAASLSGWDAAVAEAAEPQRQQSNRAAAPVLLSKGAPRSRFGRETTFPAAVRLSLTVPDGGDRRTAITARHKEPSRVLS